MDARFISGAGKLPARVMLIGEGPGREEEAAGIAFAPKGKSAKELRRYLFRNGLQLDECYRTNLVKYRVPNDGDPTQADIDRDSALLIDEIERCKPEIIVTIGRFSTRFFLGDVDMEVCHGLPTFAPGFDHGYDRTTLLPVYHPAAGLHNTEMQGLIAWDFEQVGLMARGKLTPRVLTDEKPKPDYFEDDSPLCWHTDGDLAMDTESHCGAPWGLSAAVLPGHALAQRAGNIPPHLITNVGGKILLHNSLHDLNILRKMGVEVPEDRFVDTMILAYLLCLEPQGLKPLAKRYCGMDMKAFDEVTAPHSIHRAVEFLEAATAADIWPPAEGNKHSIHKRMVRLLKDLRAGKIGNPWKRWNDVPEELKAPVIRELGDLPDMNFFDVPDEEAIPYACRDADATLRVYPILWEKIVAMGLQEVAAMDHAIVPMVDRMQSNGMKVDFAHFSALEEKLDSLMVNALDQIEALIGARINPNSGDQVSDLLFGRGLDLKLFNERGDPVPPRMTKTRKRETTNDKVLESLRGAHPVIPLICDYREFSKLKDSFCTVLPRLVDPDGRIRCNMRITRVSSGRLAASRPNLLAIPTRTDIGREVRGGFIAEEGHQLAGFDKDQIEMRVMAHESGDPTMIGLFNEGRDIHKETGAMMYRIRPADVTTVQRYAAKRVGFGVITGITADGLLDQMFLAGAMDWTKKRCQEAIDLYFEVYPGVRAYMEQKRTEARRYGYVRDMWGRIRYLPGVWSEISFVREEALRQSHSHSIQAGAQGIIKRAMKEIWGYMKGLWSDGVYFEPLLQIYDELLFEEEIGISVATHEDIRFLMEGTTQLSVPIKVKWATAQDWGSLK